MNLHASGIYRNIIPGKLLVIAILLMAIQTAFAQQSHHIPLVTAASNSGQQGFVRIINRSNRSGTVRIHAIDDTGRRFGPVSLSLSAKQARQFNSRDLERGNPRVGLSGGVGNGTGNWRLELNTSLDIEPLAYIRTPDGFLTSMHDLVQEANMCHYVPIFNPGSNRALVSWLRLINPGTRNADIVISALDAEGNSPPMGDVRLTLPAGAARMLSAQQLEQGGSGLSGRLGDGDGKWQLFVSARTPIRIMSMMQTRSGHLTNLSTAPLQTSHPAECRETGAAADLRVESVSVSDDTLDVQQRFTLYATVRNRGGATSTPAEVTAYWSFLPGASAPRNRMGSSSVPALASLQSRRVSIGGLNAGRLAGNFYFSACVVNRNGNEHCSDGIRVTVSDPTPSGSPDLYIATQREAQTGLRVGQSLTLRPGVANQGDATSAATTVRMYRSDNSTISRQDQEVGSKPLPAVPPQDIRNVAFSVRLTRTGTYYYGYCVEPVPGESDTSNNCGGASRVTVSGSAPPPPPPPQRGVTVSVRDGCNDGYRIEYRYFAFDSRGTQTGSWPGGSRLYHTTHYNRVDKHNLECDDETARICLGARQGRWIWGIGVDADGSCSNCCYACPSSGIKEYRTFGFGCPR